MAKRLLSILVHVPPIGAIVYVWWQVARWYISHLPVLGIDFYNTVTYAHYLAYNWVPKIDGWKNIWWSGHPLQGEYPTLHMYLIAPWVKWLGDAPAVQAYMVATLLVFLFFSYVSFWLWSKNHILAVVITLLCTISIAPYGALVWGGSLPYFATQMFLPAVLCLTIVYLQNSSRRALLTAGVLTGFSVWGHPQSAIVYIVPFVAILLLFYRRIRGFVLYAAVAILVAYPEMLTRISVPVYLLPFWLLQKTFMAVFGRLGAGSPAPAASPGAASTQMIAKITRENLWQFVNETNLYLFILAIMISLLFIITLRKKSLASVIGGWLLVLYQVAYVTMFAYGISFFHGGWYRVFWPFPFLLGLAICAVWKNTFTNRSGKSWQVLQISATAIVLGIGIWGVANTTGNFFTRLDTPKLAYSEFSSAWPAPLNYLIRPKHQPLLKNTLVPAWLETNDNQHRFYSADAQVNIWWNALFNMPSFRGYIDPPIGNDQRGGYFWWDVTVDNDQLVKTFKYPQAIAVNNAKFLIDWFALRYIEAGHNSSSYSPLSSYLQNRDFIKQDEDRVYVDKDSVFKYYLGLARPPLEAVNLPVVYFVGNDDTFAAVNAALHQGPAIPEIILVKGKPNLDQLTGTDLEIYDGLMLSSYGYADFSYVNRIASYARVGGFIRSGKPVFIDTGSGVVESENAATGQSREEINRNLLPPELPMREARREHLSDNWQLEITDPVLRTGIDPDLFAQLQYKVGDLETRTEKWEKWQFSYPAGPLDEGSQVLARNGGKPVLIEKQIGAGKLLWSGMDLARHASRTDSLEEKKWFNNIFTSLYKYPTKPKPQYQVSSIALGKVKIVGSAARGVLFPGEFSKARWKARDASDVPLDLAMVTIPKRGFYVDLAAKNNGEFGVEWEYTGEQNLHFYEINPPLTSPIFHPTNASVVGFVGKSNYYESFFRTLAMTNTNSKQIIPIRLGEEISHVKSADLAATDALIAYGYKSKSPADWQLVESWVRGGGKLFIDSAGEPGSGLPDLFPASLVVKKELGTQGVYSGDSAWLSNLSLDQFADPVLDGQPWQFSVPEPKDLRSGSQVLLRQQDTPILVKRVIGKGVVIWSGMNLPYHATVHSSLAEGELMRKILAESVALVAGPPPANYKINRINPQHVEISLTGNNRGILFREQAYDWHAKVDGKPAKVYATGPTAHGFVYVPTGSGSARVELKFGGGSYLNYFHYALAGLTVLLVADYTFLGSRGLTRWLTPFLTRLIKRVGGWWDTDANDQ